MRVIALGALLGGCGRIGFENTGTSTDARSPIAPTFVQTVSVDATGFATASTDYPSPVTAASLLLIAIDLVPSSDTLVSVTDSAGNTYTFFGPFDGRDQVRHYIAYAIATAGGAISVTSTLSAAPASYYDLRLFEYENTSTTAPIQEVNSATGSSVAVDGARSPSVTTIEPNELIFGFVTCVATNCEPGTNFRSRSTFGGDVVEDRIAAAPGSYPAQATLPNGGVSWTATVVAVRGR